MQYRTLGRTGLQVSVLGFGGATLGDEYGRVAPADGQRAVDAAIDSGVNLFDVAPYYGRTLAETRLGEFLRGKRDRVILSTKVGRYDRDPPHGFDFSAERVLRSAEQSLQRLRTDVIDVFLAHDIEFGERRVILEETIPAMRSLKEQGKVRFIGVTGYPPAYLHDVAAEAGVEVVLSYCHFNLLNTSLERHLAPFAREHGVGLINASPLHMGVLTRGGPPPWHPAPERVLEAGRAAGRWCAARGADLSDIALRFALARGPVASTLVGIRSEPELRANLRALDGPPDAELLRGVEEILAPARGVEWMVGLAENNPAEIAGSR